MAQELIHLILTGGTIDSHYDGSKDTAVPNRHSELPRYLNSLRMYVKLKFSEICMKDSRQLTKTDFRAILKAVEKSPAKSVVVTMGTYLMGDAAKYLNANLKRQNKTIVFTGSFMPLTGFTESDAPFNLGYALAMSQVLPAGVHICMHGAQFTPAEVAKNVKIGRFYSVFEKGKR